ncbi:MAG: hypothetical protein WDA02_11015 [Saccharofermentanales bacterium]
MAGTRGKAKRTKKGAAKDQQKNTRSSYTPPELKLSRRFLSSALGLLLTGTLAAVLLLALAALFAGSDLNLFLLLVGIILLAAIILFWVLLLYRKTANRD